MTYISWAALYEGTSDQRYFDIILPRMMEDLIIRRGVRNTTVPQSPALVLQRGNSASVAAQICESRDSFHVIFIHADTGGRSLEEGIGPHGPDFCDSAAQLCNWPPQRCIVIAPRHEVEAWVLADGEAVCAALGYNGAPSGIGLPGTPAAAQSLVDPKAVVVAAIKKVRGRRKNFDSSQIFASVAQQQKLSLLRSLTQFRDFEAKTVLVLQSLGCL